MGHKGLIDASIAKLEWPPKPDYKDRMRVLDHLVNEAYVTLQPSKIAGVGVFAFRPIPEGVDPFKFCNAHLAPKEQFVVYSGTDLQHLPACTMDQVKSFFAPLTEEDGIEPQKGDDGSLMYGILSTGLASLNMSWYLNHSEEPNVCFTEADSEGEFNTYVTRRRIEAGEELSANYRELGREYFRLVTGG